MQAELMLASAALQESCFGASFSHHHSIIYSRSMDNAPHAFMAFGSLLLAGAGRRCHLHAGTAIKYTPS